MRPYPRAGVARVDDEGVRTPSVEKVRFGDVTGAAQKRLVVKTALDERSHGYGNQCQVGMPGLLHAFAWAVRGYAVDVGQLFGGFSVRLTAITVLLASVSAFRQHS